MATRNKALTPYASAPGVPRCRATQPTAAVPARRHRPGQRASGPSDADGRSRYHRPLHRQVSGGMNRTARAHQTGLVAQSLGEENHR
jgi:hypothetical protein